MKTGDFGLTDVGRVQESYRREARYHIDNRLSDGRAYCVVVGRYSQAYIDRLTPEILARIAVY